MAIRKKNEETAQAKKGLKKKTTKTDGIVVEVSEIDPSAFREEESQEVVERVEGEVSTDLSGRRVTALGSQPRKMHNVAYSMSENYSRILNLQSSQNLCHATISGVLREEKGRPDCVVVNYLDFPIYIPLSDFITPEEEARIQKVSNSASVQLPNYNKARFEREARLKVANRCVGANIYFVITKASTAVDTNSVNIMGENPRFYYIFGSRVIAERTLRHRHFFAPSAQNHPIKVGDVVECDVIRTFRDFVLVLCCGAHVMIHRSQLFVTKWCDPMTDFAPGDSFDAVVERITVNPEKEEVAMRLTRLPLDADVADFYLRQFSSRNSFSGLVGTIAYIAVDDFRAPRFYGINLDAVSLRAIVSVKHNNYQSLQVGDRVVFTCSHIDEEQRLLSGSCEPLNITERNNW